MLNVPPLDFLEKKRVFITGGTGSLGHELTRLILAETRETIIVIFSRDEFKQYEMGQKLTPEERQRVRFFLGDVRDQDRLYRALNRVNVVIHAAALKQVPAAEYNPFEFVKTNILGAQNVITAAIDNRVDKVVALSTDKAAEPINFYGATKLCSDKLFIAGNNYSGDSGTKFAVVRYGNVVGSRGSVVPFFLQQRHEGFLPITDLRMTRFWITLPEAAAMVLNALETMGGMETFVPRIPSMRVTDLAETIAPGIERREVGVRPGEKIHETMIPKDAGHRAYSFPSHFVLLPDYPSAADRRLARLGGTAMPRFFTYSSDQNDDWLTPDRLAPLIAALDTPEARTWALERSLAPHADDAPSRAPALRSAIG
jgi:UDP-N-acetylglucosamine 4,6-dehydratase/5-epimerase